MIQAIFSLVIAVLLLGLMLYWLLQADSSRKVDVAEARNTLSHLQSKFLPVTLVDRILDYKDFAFVSAQREPRILHLLEAERRAIAKYWLGHTRLQVKMLMTFHVKSARYNPKLTVPLELRLALNYFAFLIACDAFQGLIWLRGPFYAPRAARFTMTVAARFCALSERILSIADARPPVPEQRWPAGG